MDRPRPSRAPPLALFSLFAVVILVGGGLAYSAGAADLRRRAERELATIAAFKVREVERWRDERLGDADAIAADPTLRQLARDPRSGGDATKLASEVEEWFAALRGIGDYSAVGLLDLEGAVGTPDARRDLRDPDVLALARRAAAERRPLLGELHVEGEGHEPHFALVAPISPSRCDLRYVVFLRVDPRRHFFPLLQSWPAPSPSAETLLVRPLPDRVVVVNVLRLATREPGTLWIPTSRSDDPSTLAAAGGGHVVEGVDYRGVGVLAALEPVPGTPWTVVAKLDAAEAFADERTLGLWVLLVVLAFLAASGAGVLLWWRVQLGASDRARAADEAERNALARKLDRLTRHATDLVFLADEDLRIVEVNERTARALGYARAELLGMSTRDIRDPATLADFEERVREQIEKGAAMFETRYRRKDGSTFPVEVTVHSDVYEGRRFFQGIARDVSERKAAEEALRESEARFRAVFEQASMGMTLVDATGRMVAANPAFRALLGYSEDEAARLSVSDLPEESGGPTPFAVFSRLRSGEADAIEIPRRYRRTDGRVVDAVLRAAAIRDGQRALRFVLGVFEDVTDRKRIEAQLLLADRMASVGTLAAGVAHEINNPLSFVLSNLDFALSELGGAKVQPEIVRALEDARGGGARVRAIVRDLKAFSRPTEDVREPLDVRRVLLSAIGLAANEIRQRAQIAVDPGDVPMVEASEHRLSQVFLNLLVNAAQAIPEGSVSENVVRATTGTAPDGRALVEIFDTGVGIPPELRARIFDPFFTTKPVGVGTGLGLSICHTIVTQHGGEISVESEPGRGTTFRVLLPAAPAHPRATPPEPVQPPRGELRRGRVLVVDDEALVGRAVQRVLAPFHEVVTLTDACRALELLLGDGAFDVVLCDLMMPDMTGMELHEKLREASPSLADRVVFVTGGAFTPAAIHFLERVPNERLEKPLDPGALRALVARLVGARAP